MKFVEIPAVRLPFMLQAEHALHGLRVAALASMSVKCQLNHFERIMIEDLSDVMKRSGKRNKSYGLTWSMVALKRAKLTLKLE